MTGQPLVVTLAVDQRAQEGFDDERRRLFPPGRTHVGAHVTMFHALPGFSLERVTADLEAAAQRPAFDVSVERIMSLGRGVAYELSSLDLHELHADLRSRWVDLLTRQDAQPFRPHITVQNKVSPEAARATFSQLASVFEASSVGALGLDLWHYAGGPWVLVRRFDFISPH